jgi:hypothetical protein
MHHAFRFGGENVLCTKLSVSVTRARILKLLRRPRLDSKESIPVAYVAWRAGTTTLFLLGFLAPTDCLKIPAERKIHFCQCFAVWAEEQRKVKSLQSLPMFSSL